LFHYFWSSILFPTNFQTLGMDKYNLSGKLALLCLASSPKLHGSSASQHLGSSRSRKKTPGAAHRQAEENGEESSPERRSSLEEMASEVGACRSSG
jgi:hypothetical protein